MNSQLAICPLCLVLCLANLVQGQGNTQRGAVLGGLTGAAAGAIIGNQNREAGAGAAIGGALGLVAGSILGRTEDQRVQDAYAFQQQQNAYLAQRALSPADVVQLTLSRVSDPVIIGAIRNHGVQRPLEVADIVYLSQNGVSDQVIQAMQAIGSSSFSAAGQMVVTRPVPVAVPRYVGPPVVYGYPPPSFVFRVGGGYGHGHGSCRRHW